MSNKETRIEILRQAEFRISKKLTTEMLDEVKEL
tara:strand:+ start:122 stop:223 length:102 start_codon:yes stop_codon:yes gene_type:complete